MSNQDDWDDAPEWAQYRTVNHFGRRIYWECRPAFEKNIWVSSRGSWCMAPARDLKDSLESRPKAEGYRMSNQDELETLSAENAEMLEMLRWMVAIDFGGAAFWNYDYEASDERMAQKVRELVEKKGEEKK